MKKRNKVSIKLTRGERSLLGISMIFGFVMILVQVFGGATQGNLSINVEKLKYQIEVQEKTNESLVMQVNELTSYDTIKDVVKNMGLAYNNENIIVISK